LCGAEIDAGNVGQNFAAGEIFAFETTPSGRGYLSRIAQGQNATDHPVPMHWSERP
jgi:hypothetical protein